MCLLSVSLQMLHENKILVIVVFIADFISVVSDHYMVKQHELDVVISINLICVKPVRKTAGIMCLNIVSALPFCPLTLRYNAASAVLRPTHKAPAVRE